MRVDLDSLKAITRDGDDDPAAAAGALEAYFLRQMLSEVRAGSAGGLLDGGFAGATFREMLDAKLADSMAEAGGIGLAKVIEPALTGDAAGGASEAPSELSGPWRSR